MEKLREIRETLNAETKPFVWDIDFVEIFSDEEEGGFDIVIGNPPYVRQEKIADPRLPKEKITAENRKEYREKLIHSIRNHFPQLHDVDRKCDLYVYFYFHGLALLNLKGTFCFITSNSWLDVGYGKTLQEFLLENVQIEAIYDNSAKRSFSEADINTIIALFSAPNPAARKENLNHIAKFVMFRKPFEEVIKMENLLKIESSQETLKTEDFRIYPRRQEDLLEEAWEYPEDFSDEQKIHFRFLKGKYGGDKWGNKYLRAPDIFFTILQKGKNYIEKMSGYFEGERYLNTGGADDFFILTEVSEPNDALRKVRNDRVATGQVRDTYHDFIEDYYLRPLIKDFTKENKQIEINGFDAYCFVCNEGTSTIRTKKEAYKYIRWGEKQGYNKRSVTKLQKPWYKPTRQMLKGCQILVPRSFNDTFVIHYNPKEYLSLRFYRLHLKKGSLFPLIAFLNSTYMMLILETLGNKSLGQGVLDFFMEDFLRLEIPIVCESMLEKPFEKIRRRPIGSVYEEFGINPNRQIRDQLPNPLPDRKVLDDVIFDKFGLTEFERCEVYWAVCELVKNRLEKARSV